MMTPAGVEHGQIAMKLGALLFNHVEAARLGRVFAAETGFVLARDPDTVLAPDAAFIRADRLPDAEAMRGLILTAPDFVAEVAPPRQHEGLRDKAATWLGHGAAMVWVVWPATRSVSIHRPGQPVELRHEGDRLEGEGVVPGFSCDVASIFE